MSEKDIEEIENFEKKLDQKLNKDKEAINKAEKSEKERKEKFNLISIAIKFILFFSSLIYFWIKWPDLHRSFKHNRPLRMGEYTQSAAEDSCVSNLWKALEKENKEKFSCPASSAAYVYYQESLCCPNPQIHGLKSLCLKNNMVYAE